MTTWGRAKEKLTPQNERREKSQTDMFPLTGEVHDFTSWTKWKFYPNDWLLALYSCLTF